MTPITPLSGSSSPASGWNVDVRNAARSWSVPRDTRFETSESLRGLHRVTLDLRQALKTLNLRLGGGRDLSGRQPASTTSGASLGLDTVKTAARVDSEQEVNTVATSYSPFGPTWSGSSSSEATLSGVYTGIKDDLHTFTVKRAGTVGSNDRLRIDIRDNNNNLVERVRIPRRTPAGTPFALTSGLVLELSEGDLEMDETFQIDLRTSVGSSVDPDRPFDGTRNENPNFEPGHSVGEGSFEINGTAIEVRADDTLNSVLDRITGSGLGVTASFDALAEKVRIVDDTPGFGRELQLSNDSSGFLAATKLDIAGPVAGTDGEIDVLMSQVAAFSGVAAGSLDINGESIALDPDSDTLRDVIQRINTSSAGVTAGFDARSNTLEIRSNSRTRALELSDGATDFLAAANLEAGVQQPLRTAPELARLFGSSQVSKAMRQVEESLNALFTMEAGGGARLPATLVRGYVSDAIASSLRERFESASVGAEKLESRFGLELSLSDYSDGVLDVDNGVLRATSDKDLEKLLELFVAAEDDPAGEGLIASLTSALDRGADLLQKKLGSTGALFDRLA